MLYTGKNNALFFKMLLGILVCIGISFTTSCANAAGNITDTLFEYYSTSASTGLGITNYREKLDATSAYARMESISNTQVTTIRVLGSSTPTGGYVERTAGSRKSLSPGQSVYLPNYVYENGERYLKLSFGWPAKERTTIRIWWSPDSI